MTRHAIVMRSRFDLNQRRSNRVRGFDSLSLIQNSMTIDLRSTHAFCQYQRFADRRCSTLSQSTHEEETVTDQAMKGSRI